MKREYGESILNDIPTGEADGAGIDRIHILKKDLKFQQKVQTKLLYI